MHSFLNLPSQALRLAILCVVMIVTITAGARSHELTPAVADLSFGEETFSLRIEMNLEAALAEIGPEHDDTEQSPNEAEYDALRALTPEDLATELRSGEVEFLNDINIQGGDREAEITLKSLDVPDVGDTDLARISTLTIDGALPDGAQALTFKWAPHYGAVVLRTEADVESEGYAAFLAGGETSEPIAVEGPTTRSFWTVFIDYIGIGFEHILPLGLDHILFVVGLFLLSTQLRPLLWQVTAFTLAHTVTLALGMLGIVNLPGSIVEPLIAASIVYVAVENILKPTMTPWRPAVVFIFGLLHGLGFAGVLTEFGIPDGQFVTALIGFNIGVELGQLTVIAICFALVGYWFGQRDWYRSGIVIPGSIIVALIGAYWFVERTLL